MIVLRKIMFIGTLFLSISASASATLLSFPVQTLQASDAKALSENAFPRLDISNLGIREFERLSLLQLCLKGKIGYKILQHKLKKEQGPGKEIKKDRKRNKGDLALILGILGLGVLFISVIYYLSIPLAVMAIVMGNQASKENPKSRKGKTASILGWTTIGLLTVIIALALLLLWGVQLF